MRPTPAPHRRTTKAICSTCDTQHLIAGSTVAQVRDKRICNLPLLHVWKRVMQRPDDRQPKKIKSMRRVSKV